MGRFQPTIKKIRGMQALLDVSGGDSFSDIYGQYRFDSIVGDKMVAISQGKPLILLPQTYGPFISEKNRQTASRVVRSARAVWARDERSYAIVRDLLGDQFDPERHKATVDMAFGLPVAAPDDSIANEIREFASQAEVLVGLNVSGLLYRSPSGGIEDFNFKSNYRDIIQELLKRLLAEPNVRVLLVGHVGPNQPTELDAAGLESDMTATRELLETVKIDDPSRTLSVPSHWNAMQLKWAIGQCDWFCGTRMHSCIAGLSQGVPTGAVAYSDKTIGVFETAGVGDSVIDPRVDDAETVVDKLLTSFQQRSVTKETLGQWLPVVKGRLKDFFEHLKAQIDRP
ncbi:polysaccharide pyruvyl transferase family protein [Blastopirellula marina]|nr:polysaccharide pyruvyl transferase family protein [Blastopirellula marina]